MLKFRILKTYFLEILLLVAIAIIATVVMVSWFLNSHFERSTTHMVNQLNQEFLAENHRINEYLQKMVKISGMELFFEPSVQKLMYQKDLTNFDVVTSIRRLDAVMSTNIHTHSIYVYNAANDYIYATSNVDSDSVARFKDAGVTELFSGSADHLRLAPIPRYADSPSGTIPVYSFVFYDIQKTEPRIGGALVMNITLDWLREIFKDVVGSQSQVMFVDEAGTIAYHTDSSQFLKNIAEDATFRQMVASNSPSGYFPYGAGKEKSFVFYSKSAENPLYLMRIYPYDTIMGGIVSMRITTLLLVLACITVAMILAVLISKRLYKPIHQMVSRVHAGDKEALYEEGELRFLSSSIDRMLTQAETFEETTESYRTLLQTDVLREILMGKIGDPDLMLAQFKEYKLPFSLEAPLQLIGLKPLDERALERLGLGFLNIHMEVPFEGERMLVVTQNCNAQQLQDLYDRSIASGVELVIFNRRIEHPFQLANHASLILEELRFSFMYDTGIKVEEKELKRSLNAGVYPSELEKNLLHLLHQGRAIEAYDVYTGFFGEIAKYSFTHFRFSMKRLYISLQLLVKEMQETGCFIDSQELSIGKFELSLESLVHRSDLDDFFRQWFDRFEEELQRCKAQKNRAIAEQIKQVVEEEYANPNLCLQFLADKVHLSVSYVSKVFKDCEGVSVSDYCLGIRMGKAAEMLEESDIPVKDIASAIGFSNENYFYAVFRKQRGFTPNEFRKRARL